MESTIKQSDNEAYYDRAVSASLRIGFVALLFFLSFLILKPFIVLVLWSIIIAVGIYPIFRKLSTAMGNKDKLASTIITLTALALLIVPSILLLDSTIESVQNVAAEYEAGTIKAETTLDPTHIKIFTTEKQQGNSTTHGFGLFGSKGNRCHTKG